MELTNWDTMQWRYCRPSLTLFKPGEKHKWMTLISACLVSSVSLIASASSSGCEDRALQTKQEWYCSSGRFESKIINGGGHPTDKAGIVKTSSIRNAYQQNIHLANNKNLNQIGRTPYPFQSLSEWVYPFLHCCCQVGGEKPQRHHPQELCSVNRDKQTEWSPCQNVNNVNEPTIHEAWLVSACGPIGHTLTLANWTWWRWRRRSSEVHVWTWQRFETPLGPI